MKTKIEKSKSFIKTHKKEIALVAISVAGTCLVLKGTGVIPSGKYMDLIKHLKESKGDGVNKFIELSSSFDGMGVIEYDGKGKQLKELGELGEKIRGVIDISEDSVFKGLAIFVEEH